MLKFGNIDLNLKQFTPYLNFWTGHSQTLLGHLAASENLQFQTSSEVLCLPDGDELLVEYHQGTKPFTLSIYHGLGGDAQADYMRRSALLAYQLGWNVVLVNHRSASALVKAKKSYHSGRGEDAEFVIKWCRQKFENTKQIALGFSMSGSILLNLLTYRHGHEQPDFAIIVNAPLDLADACDRLTQGFSQIYDLRFFLKLKKGILQNHQEYRLPLIGRTLDIDDLYTAPINNFKNRQDYYEKCSTGKYLQNIKTKTFVLTAKDDPFINVRDYIEMKWSESVHLTICDHGGHMGYYSKEYDSKYGRRWLDHYLESVLQKIQII